jgi:hypothetical protein
MRALECRFLFDAAGLIDPAILDMSDVAARRGDWHRDRKRRHQKKCTSKYAFL